MTDTDFPLQVSLSHGKEVTHMLNKFFSSLSARLRQEDGQAMAEYGIILALVAVVVIASVQALGVDVKGAFDAIVKGI